MTLRVRYTDAAEEDLANLAEYLAAEADAATATAFTDRIRAVCDGFSIAAERGTRLDNVRPGLRFYGWRRRVTILFRVALDEVVIAGIFYGGRDFEAAIAARDFDA